MLPKKLRMDKTSAKEVFMRPESTYASPHFLLKVMKNPAGSSSDSLFAVSISKKVANTAVLRNRTRRRVYTGLRELTSLVKPGYVAGFAVKTGGERLESSDVLKEIQELLNRARLFAEE